jgi:hypothetical protein
MSLDGRYRFYVGEEVENPDFWVVQSKGLRQVETYNVARANTILLTTEPRSVLVYPRKYTRQFGMLCTCQPKAKHPNRHLTPPILPWFLGYTAPVQQARKGEAPLTSGSDCYTFTQSYDTLKAAPTPQKTKLLSVITSNKAFTRGHIDRIKFVEKLKQHYGEQLDVFGEGFRPFKDKWDVTVPYQYQLVIENSSEPYYWTEKLGDCFLAETFPFYYGCTNVADYFPREAYEPIDIHDADAAIAIIDREVAAHRYEQAVPALHICKERMLDEYNMFEYIARLCDQLNPDAPKEAVTLRPCHSMDSPHNAWNYMVKRNYYKTLYALKGGKL